MSVTRAVLPLLLWLLATSLLAAPVRAAALTEAQREGLLTEAQAAYDRGVAVLRKDPQAARLAFEESASRFQQLADDAPSGRLLYNLGNARLQAGQLGEAILQYRRAERLIPADPRLEHNLQQARSLRRNRLAESGERALAGALLGWHERVPAPRRFVIFAIAWVGFWLVLAVQRVRPAAAWRWTAAVCLALWGATGTSVAVSIWGGDGPVEGVTLRDDIVVRKGNGIGFEPQFAEALHQGVEVIVLTERADWMQIELPDGKTGWVPTATVGLIGAE
jgi:uncharacterized protein YdbL (DUF1318 family)